jgi:RNA polymerase sigma-70 factor (ECF subfamily)
MDGTGTLRFEALFRVHAGAVRTYVCRRCGVDAADDVVADVFVVAWRRLDDVPDDPLPWLLGVARRVLANRRRGEARRHALLGRVRFESHEVMPVSGAQPDSGGRVLRVLSSLSDRDREALLLVAWEGLSAAQAAKVLGVSPNTFAARLARARRRFVVALAAESDPPAQQPVSVEGVVLR